MRDITLGETFTFGFTTRAFTTGVPGTLGGTPVLSVKEGANDTPITAGVSVDVDTCATPVTGLNEGTIVATSANGYEAGKSYFCYISTGTVGGVSVVGEIVCQFTIQLGAAFTRLGAPAGASVSADIAAVKSDTGGLVTTVGAAGVGLTSVALSAAGITAVWAYVITGSTTAVQAVRGFIAAMLGKASGLPTAPVYRNIADNKNVIVATTDTDGNRTAVTLDLS